MAERFTGTVADFWDGGRGGKADLVLFANIFHLQTAEAAEKLLRNAAGTLGPDSLVCIADQIVMDDTQPLTAQDRFAMLFAVSMLATGGDTAYSLSVYDEWPDGVGLERVAVLDAPDAPPSPRQADGMSRA